MTLRDHYTFKRIMEIVLFDGAREFPINPLLQGERNDRVYFARNVINPRHNLVVPMVSEPISQLNLI
jgi:hypothetical protein